MAEIEKHLSRVVHVAERISKFVSNTSKTGKEKRTEAFLAARIQLLESYWSNYQEQNDKICEIATPDEIKSRQYFTADVFSDVECAYTEALGWLKDELNQLQPSSIKSQEPLTPSSSQSSVKLPKINLPTFSGSYIEWPAYRDTYISLIHDNSTLSDIQKMHYLKSSVTGAASKLLQHLVVTTSNYTAAWNILTSRFENTRLLVNSNLHMIMSIPSMTSESAKEIRRILDNYTQSVRALENLQRPVNHWDDWLVYVLSSKLDQLTRKDWETSISSSTSVPALKSLTDFLEGRLHTLEAINDSGGTEKKNRGYSHRGKITAQTYHISSSQTCPLCKGKHILMFCNVFKAKSVNERMLIVENHGLCSNCLKTYHANQQCPSKNRCKICNRDHHTMLHRETRATSSQQQTTTNTHNSFTTSPYLASNCTALSSANRSSTVLLATAIVIVHASNGRTVRARALLDQGSESSFISSSLAKLLRLDRHKVHIPIFGVGGTQAGVAESQVSYKITSIINEQYVFDIQSFVLPKLAQFIPTGQVNNGYWPHIAGLELADPQFSVSASIDLILGADVYSRILLNEVRHGPPGTPTAQRTALGWILSGPTSNSNPDSIVCLHCSQEENLNHLLRKFWELEEINTRLPLSPEQEECEEFFRSSHRRDDNGRFIVRLPLKTTSKQLGDSHQYALASMLRNERVFKQDPLLKHMYISFMDEYTKLGHMVPVISDDEPVSSYHLPHHAVLKPTSTTTKLRVVFNASRQTTTGVSLNDILHIGPKVQNDVASIILKWRQYPIVFSTDIEKMFRQILVHPSDTNLQRILWRKNPSEPIQCYRLCTVTYGTASAPYLACRTLLQLAEDHQEQFPLGAVIIRNNFYVDDGLFGAFDTAAALQARDEIRSLMKLGGFRLRKWLSNRPELLEDISDEDKELPSMPRFVTDEEFKALGIYWFPLQDLFKLHVSLPEHKTITKRTILSDISRLYDPLGWITPITINAKILMQQLWLAGCNWDEELPPELMGSWIKYKANLQSLSSLCINRWIGITGTQSSFELHGFCDASMAAYSAVVYIRVLHDTDNIQVTLLSAKAKVSPIKTVSLPRLELCGATLLAELLESVQKSLNMEDVSVHVWSDSTIVLSWLKAHPSRWKVFVANRVSTIHQKIPNATWHHVPSAQNPADIATRGCIPDELKSFNLWWTGPDWLTCCSSTWPKRSTQTEDVTIPEEREETLSYMAQETSTSLALLLRYSNLNKALRVTAYCRRFLLNARLQQRLRRVGSLTQTELNSSLNHWTNVTQELYFPHELKLLSAGKTLSSKSKLQNLNPFVDKDRVLRVGGRLKHSCLSYSQKHPIILPKDGHLTQLIIDRSHTATLHGGTQLTLHHIRDQFWILNGRSKVKEFIRKCLVCYRYKATTKNQLMADLPADRVRPAKPFLNSGVDFAGPVHVKPTKGRGTRSVKAYISVFVCLATRAIHLELVMSLSSESFVAAFKRFIARRGRCNHIYSDNATNFVAADKELQLHWKQLCSDTGPSNIHHLLLNDGTEWHFIPPAAPHFGGIWEAGVKAVKHHLRRVTRDHILTIEEMLTLLASVEACLNSRPLHAMSDDPDDLAVLTPGHFLLGDSPLTVPEVPTMDVPVSRLNRWQLVQNMYEHLWNRWYKEYIHHLQIRNKWATTQESVKVNDLVLIKEEKLPPSKWALGRVTKVHPGSDGHIRVVTLKYQGGFCTRPITKICALPVDKQN